MTLGSTFTILHEAFLTLNPRLESASNQNPTHFLASPLPFRLFPFPYRNLLSLGAKGELPSSSRKRSSLMAQNPFTLSGKGRKFFYRMKRIAKNAAGKGRGKEERKGRGGMADLALLLSKGTLPRRRGKGASAAVIGAPDQMEREVERHFVRTFGARTHR